MLQKAGILTLLLLLSSSGSVPLLAESTDYISAPSIAHHHTHPNSFAGSVLYVGGSGPDNYTAIQDAIDNATDGDTIFVFSGIYLENLTIDKQLTIVGEEKSTTIIKANTSYEVVSVLSDFVTIQGFTITRENGGNYYRGIHAEDNFTTIRDNIFSEVGIGVSLEETNANIIENNKFIESGIEIPTSDIFDNTVTGNTVNDLPLLYLDSVTDATIDAPAGQIILLRCQNITITNQDITDTVTAILALDSEDLVIIDNTIENNYRRAVHLVRTEDVVFSDNTVKGNQDMGLYLTRTVNVAIIHNNIYMNYGGMFFEFCELCEVTENNFANNGFYVISIFGSLNTWDANYWDRPRFFPKLIFEFPRLNIDLHPADTPY